MMRPVCGAARDSIRNGSRLPTAGCTFESTSGSWQDEALEWERVRGRAGVPPTAPSRCLRGCKVRDAAYEQYMRLQSNSFEVRTVLRSLRHVAYTTYHMSTASLRDTTSPPLTTLAAAISTASRSLWHGVRDQGHGVPLWWWGVHNYEGHPPNFLFRVQTN